MKHALGIFLGAVTLAGLSACIPRPDVGKEGEPCSDKKYCLPGLECSAQGICASAPADGGDEIADAGTTDAGCVPDCAGKCGGPDACDGTCPNNCVLPQTCGGGGWQYVCGCTPDCNGRCGGPDACGGTCPDNCILPETCGGGGVQFVCGFTPTCGSSPTGKGGHMCDVPAGAFRMGCNGAVDAECGGEEAPYHEVKVPAFKMDKFEVMTAEYQDCVDSGGCAAADTGSGCNYNVPGKESHPINCVDWHQAKAYCEWAGKRLPTEAEWEKAARGTDGRKYPWGNEVLDCNRAVHSVSPCSNAGTAPVGSKPTGSSPYGAMDMVGNVFEWVEDDYHGNYTGAPADGSAWTDNPRGTYRGVRGGDWRTTGSFNLRASYRYTNPLNYGYNHNGFRCSGDGI